MIRLLFVAIISAVLNPVHWYAAATGDLLQGHYHPSATTSATSENMKQDIITARVDDNDDDDDDIAHECSTIKYKYASTPAAAAENDLLSTFILSNYFYPLDGKKYDSMICWLYNLKLNIPDEKFRSGIFSVSIKDMVCSKVELQSLSSEYIPSSSSSSLHTSSNNPSLSVSINGISATCSGKYHSGLTGGTVTVTVQTTKDQPSIYTLTNFIPYYIHTNNTNSSTIIAPHQADITKCQTNIQVPKKGGVVFSGSISAKIIGLFSSSIAKHVTDALEADLCPNIQKGIGGGWNKALDKLDEELEHLIHETNHHTLDHGKERNFDIITAGEWNETQADLINWEGDLFFWKKALMSFNTFLNSHLDRGIILSFLEMMGWYNHNPDPNQKDYKHLSCHGSVTDCGLFFRGVNGMIRYVTDSGSLNITYHGEKIEFTVAKLGDVTLSLLNTQIDGLDTFTKLDLQPSAKHGVSMNVENEEGFQVLCRMELKIDPIKDGIIQGGSLHETFDLGLNVSSVELQAGVDLGISRHKLKQFTLGDAMRAIHQSDAEAIRPILSSISYANVSYLRPGIHIDAFAFQPIFTDDSNDGSTLEASLDSMMNTIIQLFLDEYDELWTKALIAYGDGPLKVLINNELEKIIGNQINSNMSLATEDEEQNEQEFFSFSNSTTLRAFHDYFASMDWINRWNSFMSCVMKFLKDSTLDRSNIPKNQQSAPTGGLSFDIQDLTFENIGQIQGLDLLNAIDQFHAISKVTSNWYNQTESTHLQNENSNVTSISMGLVASLLWPKLHVNASFSTFASIGGFISEIGSKFAYNLDTFHEISLYDPIANPFVLSTPIHQELTGIYGTQSSIDTIDLSFNISASIANESRHFTYKSLDESAFGAAATSVLSTTMIMVQNFVNAGVQLALNLQHENNNPSLHYLHSENNDVNAALLFGMLGITFVIFNALYFYCGSKLDKRKLYHQHRKLEVKSMPLSLAYHQKISFFLRTLVPLIIVATIIIFIVSNLSTGASVDIELSGDNKFVNGSISIPSVFTFSLGKTVSEMYQAKVYTLMSLVLIFSGIWPYVKLLLMLFTWVTNEKWLSHERRERLLIWLDAFGKFSLVDSFVLVLMLVSFKFHFYLPEIGMIDSYVIPKDGFYTFLLATVLSLVIGHTCTFLHRYSTMPQIPSDSQSRKESLLNHSFEFRYPHHQHMQISSSGRWIWLILNVSATILLIIGVIQKCFIFEFKGLAGVVLEDEREAHYSLLSLGTSLPLSVKNSSDIGIICIEWTYFFFALVMPFASVVVVNILFFIPMSLKNQNRLFVFAEICNAWSAIEVFLLSVFASMLELSQFAAFMVGDHCDFLKGDFIKDLFHEDDTCFSVQSRLGVGVIYLCVGVFMQCMIMHISLRLCHQAVDERLDDEGLLVHERRKKETDTTFFKIISLVLFRSNLSD